MNIDPEAQLYLKAIENYKNKNENTLYQLLNEISANSVNQLSNTALIIFSTFNYALITSDLQLFRFCTAKMEEAFVGKETFDKPLTNIVFSYFSYYSQEVYDKELRLKFMKVGVFVMFRTMLLHLKQYCVDYFAEDEYTPKKETQAKGEVLLSNLELLMTHMCKLSKENLKIFKIENIQKLAFLLITYLKLEKRSDFSLRLFRSVLKFFKIDIEILRGWVVAPSELDEEFIRELKRYERYLTFTERPIAQLGLSSLEKWRLLDSKDQQVQAVLPSISTLVRIYPDNEFRIEKESEKVFLEQCRVMLSRLLNESGLEEREFMNKLLIELCKKYKGSFGELMKEAEQNNQPKRMSLLMGIWKSVLTQ